MAKARKEAPVAAESTLQKLKNLEQEHTSLSAQLKQLALLLDQPDITDSSFTYQDRSAHILGKADWALRWVTKKLAANDEAGNEARCSPSTWIFLANLLRVLPISSSTQILKNNAFLKSVERAMPQDKPSAQSYSTDNGSRHASKRRRLSEDEQSPIDCLEVVAAIERCFDMLDILTRDSESHGNNLEVEYLQSTLRTSSTTAAKILRGYFIAAEHSYLGRLGSFLSIWEHRITEPRDFAIFSQTCFVQSAAYLLRLDDGETRPYGGNADRAHAIQEMEALLARHIALPARAAFHAQKLGDKQLDLDGADAKSLLKPYEDLVKDTNVVGASESHFARRIAPRLLDIGVRCTSLDSTRNKALEVPWLESLFLDLALAAGLSLDSATDASDEEEKSNVLCDMLDVFIQHRVPVGSALLSRLARGTKSWKTVSLILRLNSDVYVNASDVALPADLWERITGLKSRHDIPSSALSAYQLVKSSIIPNMMRAYASSRKLTIFLQLWKEQIAKQDPTHKHCDSSIWEHYELVHLLRTLLEASLDTEQVLTLANAWYDQLAAKPDAGYADAVMLNVLLESLQTTRTVIQASEAVERIRQLCIGLLCDSSLKTVATSRAMWRLYGTCNTLLLEIVSSDVAQQFRDVHLPSLASAARETIGLTKTLKGSAREAQRGAAAEALRTYGKVLDALGRRHLLSVEERSKSKPNGVSKDEIKLKKKSKESDDSVIDMAKISAALAAGVASTKHSQWQSTCVSILVEHPLIFGLGAGQEERVTILTSAIQLQMQNLLNQSAGNYRWAEQLATQAVYHAWLLEDVKTALSQDALGLSSLYKSQVPEDSAQAIETIFLHLPSDLIPRPLRERTLDASCESLVKATSNLSSTAWTRRLSLLAKLLRLPHGGCSVSLMLLPLLDQMCRLNSPQEGSNQRRMELHGLTCEVFSQSMAHSMQHGSQSAEKDDVKLMYQALTGRALDGLSVFHLAAATALMRLRSSSQHDLQELQILLFSAVCKRAKKLLGNMADVDAEWRQALLDFVSSAGSYVLSEMDPASEKVLIAFKSSFEKRDEPGVMTQSTLQLFVASGSFDVETTLRLLEQPDQTVSQRHATETQVLSAITRQDATEMDSIAQQVLKHLHRRGAPALLCLLLDPSSGIDWSHITYQSSLLVGLCQQIKGNIDVQSFKHLSDAIKLLLQLKTRGLSQHALETVMGMVVCLTSPSSPTLDAQHAALIHSRLCGIMAALLTVHRRSTRGRFHLVLPALQGLLQCMFVADTTLPARSRLPQPTWISSQQRDSKGLGVAQASAVSRLVTLICEPSASAVRSGHSNSGNGQHRERLVDETAAARAYAGRYMGRLVLWWCECQLRGRVAEAEARDVLVQQAMASALGVVPRTVLEAQAAAGVRGEGRAVLKGLLEEWRRSGGGGIGDYKSGKRG